MPITPSFAPESVTANALAESHLLRGSQPRVAAYGLAEIGGGQVVGPQASPPLPIYSIPMEDLAKQGADALSSARQNGWRVLTSDANGTQLVDLSADSHEPISVIRGASSSILAKAGIIAEEKADPSISYEPRLLDFGRLGMSALWLHSTEGQDLFFALESNPVEKSEAELLNDAAARARKRLNPSDQGGGEADPNIPSDIGG